MSAEPKKTSEGGDFNFGNVLVYSAAFVIVIAGLQAAASILVPVLLAVFITIVLTPAYFKLQQWMSPTIALTLLIFGLVMASFGMVALVSNSVEEFTENKDVYQTNVTVHVNRIMSMPLVQKLTGAGQTNSVSTNAVVTNLVSTNVVSTNVPSTNGVAVGDVVGEKKMPEKADDGDNESFDLAAMLESQLKDNTSKVLNYAGVAAGTVGAMLGNTFLIVMIAIFLLLEAAFLPKKIKNLPGMNDETWGRLTAAVVGVRQYTELKTLLSLMTGFLCWAMLAWMDVQFAILFGLLAFILNYVPNIGSLIAAVPAVLIAWVGASPEDGLQQAAIVAIGYVAINTVVGNIIEPKVLDKGLGLSASIIVVTMVFWGWVLGPVAMLLSVPLTMIAKIALEASNDTQWIGAMMGSEDEAAPPEKAAVEAEAE
ncbi:MAG: AI-2E family transporter [Limisphaerales bacterium]